MHSAAASTPSRTLACTMTSEFPSERLLPSQPDSSHAISIDVCVFSTVFPGAPTDTSTCDHGSTLTSTEPPEDMWSSSPFDAGTATGLLRERCMPSYPNKRDHHVIRVRGSWCRST